MQIANTIQARGKRLVCRIYKKNNSLDCYTIAFKGYRSYSGGKQYNSVVYPYLGCSDDPFQGVGMHGESEYPVKGRHLGKRVSFDSLPLPVQKFILQSI